MKEYVHGLFTTEVEINWTSDCKQLYFVESIRKNFVLTDRTGSYCNGGLHSLFTSCRGLRSVACNLCTHSDQWKSVSGNSKFEERFLCCHHILTFMFFWFVKSGGLKKVMLSILPNALCKCWKKTSVKLWNLSSSFTACLQPAAIDFVPELDQISLGDNFFHSGIYFWHKIVQEC